MILAYYLEPTSPFSPKSLGSAVEGGFEHRSLPNSSQHLQGQIQKLLVSLTRK